MVGSPGSGRSHVQLHVHPVQEGAVNGPRQVGGGQHQHVPLLSQRIYTQFNWMLTRQLSNQLMIT